MNIPKFQVQEAYFFINYIFLNIVKIKPRFMSDMAFPYKEVLVQRIGKCLRQFYSMIGQTWGRV